VGQQIDGAVEQVLQAVEQAEEPPRGTLVGMIEVNEQVDVAALGGLAARNGTKCVQATDAKLLAERLDTPFEFAEVHTGIIVTWGGFINHQNPQPPGPSSNASLALARFLRYNPRFPNA
jgi:hypothetical protein